MNRKGYMSLPITGLRSNPKLCNVRDFGCEIIVDCGLSCGHLESTLMTKKNEHQKKEVIKILKKKVIEKHDQWMKDTKRDRVRAGNTGSMPDGSLQIRRVSPRLRWAFDAPVSRANP